MKLQAPGLQFGGRDQEASGPRFKLDRRQRRRLRRLRGRSGPLLQEAGGPVPRSGRNRRDAPEEEMTRNNPRLSHRRATLAVTLAAIFLAAAPCSQAAVG